MIIVKNDTDANVCKTNLARLRGVGSLWKRKKVELVRKTRANTIARPIGQSPVSPARGIGWSLLKTPRTIAKTNCGMKSREASKNGRGCHPVDWAMGASKGDFSMNTAWSIVRTSML